MPVAIAETLACRFCGESAPLLFTDRVLGKHDVAYFQCHRCDLIQTQPPHWLAEAYSSAICAADTGAIARNLLTSRLTWAIARIFGLGSQSRFLDFGGGHGVFVRMMRDRGLPFRRHDTYAQNLFAVGFEGSPTDAYDLVTAFEVLEHLVDVHAELENLFSGRPAAVLISTMLHRNDDKGWWYYSPHTGQHVAFYSALTMRQIAARFGYTAAGGRAYTLFLRNDATFTPWRARWAKRLVQRSKGNATHRQVAAIDWLWPRLPSLTMPDSDAAKSSRQ